MCQQRLSILEFLVLSSLVSEQNVNLLFDPILVVRKVSLAILLVNKT